VVTAGDGEAILSEARDAGVPARVIGRTSDDGLLTLLGSDAISLDMLRSGHEGWLPDYMRGA